MALISNNSNEFVFNFYDISQRIEQNPLWIWETQSSNYVSDLNYLVVPTSLVDHLELFFVLFSSLSVNVFRSGTS